MNKILVFEERIVRHNPSTMPLSIEKRLFVFTNFVSISNGYSSETSQNIDEYTAVTYQPE